MADETTTEETTATTEGQESEESTETSTEEGSEKETEETTEESNEEGSEGEDVPAEVLREKLTKANAQAANYRTKVRELEQRLEGAKSEDDIAAIREELKTERETSERALVVENVALKHELSDELTAILSDLAEAGKTREELEAHAKVLQKSAPKEEVDPENLGGGLDPSDKDGAFDPVAEARKARANRYH